MSSGRLSPWAILCLATLWQPVHARPIGDVPGGGPDCADYPPWLDEVRAQREVWEQQRDRMKREVETHQYLRTAPWGMAQGRPETASQAGLDPPAGLPYPMLPWLDQRDSQALREFRLKENEARREAQRHSLDWQREEWAKRLEAYPPFGWDNPWYYRGF